MPETRVRQASGEISSRFPGGPAAVQTLRRRAVVVVRVVLPFIGGPAKHGEGRRVSGQP